MKILVKPEEAAELLSISRSRVYELIAAHDLPVVKTPSIRLRVADLEEWAARQIEAREQPRLCK